jgi:hypothetical protein
VPSAVAPRAQSGLTVESGPDQPPRQTAPATTKGCNLEAARGSAGRRDLALTSLQCENAVSVPGQDDSLPPPLGPEPGRDVLLVEHVAEPIHEMRRVGPM